MPDYRDILVPYPVELPRRALLQMMRLVRILVRLSASPAYRSLIAQEAPQTALFDPGHDAVMMGYDFHLQGDAPRLIEVNTNAGGALLAYLAHFPSAAAARERLPERLRIQFLRSFSEEMRAFSRGAKLRPERLVILDEEPQRQFLYREMEEFAAMFKEAWGTQAAVLDPGSLEASAEGVFLEGNRIDMVYNRHCDFYLQRDEMRGLRDAYLAGSVCLTPNPFAYGLLADKRRMTLWSDGAVLAELGLQPREIALLSEVVPESRMMNEFDREALWRERRHWVFKPVSRFGSRGVFLGRKISRTRYDELPPQETLLQREVPPSETPAQGGGAPMKTDFRLYVYRTRILGVTARLYQGQVTNLRTPGGGFAPVKIRL
jgi:hypothetical protein